MINGVNLKNWVINGPLCVKYGGLDSSVSSPPPPPTQNPGHAPVSRKKSKKIPYKKSHKLITRLLYCAKVLAQRLH